MDNHDYLKNISELDLCKKNIIETIINDFVESSTFNKIDDISIETYELFKEWMIKNKLEVNSFYFEHSKEKIILEYWLHKFLFELVRQGNLAEMKIWINLFNIKDLNIFSEYGNSLLSSACYNNMFHIASYLVKKGANVNTKNNKGKTALHRIFNSNKNNEYKDKIFLLLKDNGVKVNYSDREGNIPLHYCLENKEIYLAIQLIDMGSNLITKNKDGLYPLHFMTKNVTNEKDLILFDKLISKCKNIDLKILDKYNNNLLLYCFGRNNYVLANHLIKKYKMDINNVSRIKEYIIRYIDNCWIEIYRLFLEYYPKFIDYTIFEYCKENNREMAFNTFFYFANNCLDQKIKFNGQDPLNVIDTEIKNLIQ